MLFVGGETPVLATEALINELEIVSLHLEEGGGDDAVGRLRVLILGRHFLAPVLHKVDATVDFNTARDDRLLAATDLRLDGLQLLAFEERVACKCNGDAKLLPRVVDIHLVGHGQRVENLVREEVVILTYARASFWILQLLVYALLFEEHHLEVLAEEHEHVDGSLDVLRGVDHED